MKLKPWAMPAVVIIAGTFGLATHSIATSDDPLSRSETPSERYPTSIEDDQALPRGVTGITENNTSDMSRRQVQVAQKALKDEGYDPGRDDGVMDNDTRAAIRDFQKDNELVITGTVDERTAEVLGIRPNSSG